MQRQQSTSGMTVAEMQEQLARAFATGRRRRPAPPPTNGETVDDAPDLDRFIRQLFGEPTADDRP